MNFFLLFRYFRDLGKNPKSMVLLAAAVCTRSGKAIVSRQFIEMSRARIEGLLSAYPKLMNSDSKGKLKNTKGMSQKLFF